MPDKGAIPPLSGNPLAFWQGRPVSFLHFERTGGTTLAAALTDKFHPLQIEDNRLQHETSHLNREQMAARADALRSCKLIWGHYDLPALRRLGPDHCLLTMLREPVPRILSLYYFWRSVHPSQLADMSDTRVLLAQKLDLLSFLQSDHQPLRDTIDNVYVRRLTGLYGSGTPHDPLEGDPENALSCAVAALERFAFVGISDHMRESFRGIQDVLRVDLGESQRLNDAASNPALQPTLYRHVAREGTNSDIQSALDRLTRLDCILYDAARTRILRVMTG